MSFVGTFNVLCYWCKMILRLLAYETWLPVLKVKRQIDEWFTFLQDISVYFLAEYSDDILYGEHFGWNIFETLVNDYIQWGDFLLFYLYVFYIKDPSFGRNQINHFVMETNTQSFFSHNLLPSISFAVYYALSFRSFATTV